MNQACGLLKVIYKWLEAEKLTGLTNKVNDLYLDIQAEKLELTNKVKEIAKKIGEFYLKKWNGNYDKAGEEIRAVGFTEIKIVEDKIHITVNRPGILIGSYGNNIKDLITYLNYREKIHIVENQNNIEDFIIPHKDNLDW